MVGLEHFHESVKEVGGVGGAGGGFGVKLAGEKWKFCVADAFVCVVVEVFEPDFPSFVEGFFVDGETVVLGGDVAVACVLRGRVNVLDGLVLGAVAEF